MIYFADTPRAFWALVLALCAGVQIGILALPAEVHAQSWTAVDDRVLRADVELLADAGVIRGPLASWPVNWSQLEGALRDVDFAAYPPHVREAALRVRRQVPGLMGMRKNAGWEVDLAATNQPALIRGFGARARGEYDVQGRFLGALGGTTLSLSLGLQDEDFGRDLTFDNAYLSQEVGNWIAYAGTVERWWGPGWSSAQVFSTSARPQPQIGLRRNRPDAFASKWLSWIGPWSLDAFVSIQDESDQRFSNNVIAGLRIEIQPIKGLTFAGKRAIQLCGTGRPCSINTWVDSIIVFGDRDNTGTFDEPGNQLAGIDFRYGNTFGKVAYSLYGEINGEDEDNWLIGAYATLWGGRLSGPWGENGARWELIGEYSDTMANRSFPDPNRPDVVYSNFIYTDGWVYRGRPIGASQDNDTRLVTITGTFTDSAHRFFRVGYNYVDLNTDGRGRHSISMSAETIHMAEAEAIVPTRFGDLRAELRLQSDSPNTPLVTDFQAGFELSLRMRF